jgi:sialate O-acetylesterase
MNYMKFTSLVSKSVFLFASVVMAHSAFADVRPAHVFSDHMVLQRDASVPVWGTADAGEKVTVKLAGQSVSTTANAQGKWIVKMNRLGAGGPYTLTIKGKNSVTISDVYLGEVWLCSGQSNMDMTVAREDLPASPFRTDK